jgi:hypothetical protein
MQPAAIRPITTFVCGIVFILPQLVGIFYKTDRYSAAVTFKQKPCRWHYVVEIRRISLAGVSATQGTVRFSDK